MYILAAFGGSMGESDKFDYLTPFKHFEATRILNTGEFDIPKMIISLVSSSSPPSPAMLLYQRRNIPTV